MARFGYMKVVFQKNSIVTFLCPLCLSFNLCHKDNDSDGSDGEETKIEFKTDHEDKYDEEKYDHDNDISKEIDKSTLSFVEWEPMEVKYSS